MSIKFVKLPVDIIGTVSDRAAILYALMLDRLELSKQNKQFHDDSGTPFIYFTFADVQERFHIGQAQARATLKELEYAGLIVRKLQGKGNPARTYIVTAEKSALQTAEKSALQTAEKSALQTAEKSARNQTDRIRLMDLDQSSSGGEICENQTTFDDLFLMMTTKDIVAEILCKLCAENQQEFAEINAEIINFVAENIRKAAENKKIANLRGYARAALRHGKSDFETARSRPAPSSSSSSTGYAATYNIAEYERYGIFDDYFYFDTLPSELEHLHGKLMYGHRFYLKDLSAAEREQVERFADSPAHCEDDV